MKRVLASTILAAALTAGTAAADMEAGLQAFRRGDYAAAFTAFKTEAEKGDARGQYNLGVMYLTGRGVARDTDQGVAWYRRAAEQGLAAAQHGLGVLYYRGEGVPRDHVEAASWFRKAADQGFAEAQYNLGVMYFNGEGVEQNMAEVVKWISLAAGQGYADAQFRLGLLYLDGTALPHDRGEALKWFRKAAAAGSEKAAARLRALAAREAAEATALPADRRTRTPADPPAAERPARQGPVAPEMAPARNQIAEPAKPPGAAAPGSGASAGPAPNRHEAVAAAASRPSPGPAKPAGPEKPPAAMASKSAPGPATGWRIQLAAYRSAAEAEAGWHRLVSRRAEIFEGLAPHLERADLGPRGVFHRLQTGPMTSRSEAERLCRLVRNALPGQPCVVVPPRPSRFD